MIVFCLALRLDDDPVVLREDFVVHCHSSILIRAAGNPDSYRVLMPGSLTL